MLRRIITFTLDKPLLNHMLLLFIVLLSVFAYMNISKEIFPPIQMDKISITGGYPGTSADVLDNMVVRTVEDDLKNINEIDTIETTIKNGSFSMIMDIKPGSDNANVLNDVKDVIAKVKRDLPADMNDPIAKIHIEAIPLMLIAIAGDVPTKELLIVADELKSRLSQFKDLSEITIRGDADDELVIRLNEEKVRAYGLQASAVVAALQNLSSIFPIGTIKQKGSHLYISTYNGEKERQGIEETLITVGKQRVRIGDIASVSFELSDETELSHYNGMRNVSINITKAKSGNAIALVKEIRGVLESYHEKYPKLVFDIYTDTSIWIKNRLNTVVSNIIFGLILVFFAMLIFVNRGIALVVAMGIPVSFMIGLIVTNMIGYSLNMLTLLGGLMALGMLVDEAIVVAENIYRHMEEGMPRREATIRGTMEMFPAVLTATLTTVFAFIPLLILSGEMGEFIKVLPIMISVLLISSLIEAFFFLPLHSHELLRVRKEEHMSHAIWSFLYRIYDKILHTLFSRKIISLIGMVVLILGITVFMAKQTRFQLFPDFDVTQIYVSGKVNINNDLENSEKIVSTIEQNILSHMNPDEIGSVTSVIGMRLDAKNKAEIGENLFHIFIELHERAPDDFYNTYINPIFSIEYDPDVLIRKRSARMIANDVQQWVEPYTEAFEELTVTTPGTGVVAHDVEISVGGKGDDELIKAIDKIQTVLRGIKGVSNVANDADLGEKELKLRVNSYGQELGFNEQIITNELRSYYLKGEYAKMFNSSGLVRVRIEGVDKDLLDSLENFQVQIPNTQQFIALDEVCDFIYEQAYVTINKEDGDRIRTVFASLSKTDITSAEVMQAMASTLDEIRDEGMIVVVKGEEQESAKTIKELSEAGAVAILLILITLVWLFDSLKQSLIVLSTIPLVLLGVYGGHWIMGLNMTMPGMIGTIGLAGVVVNDGLIMVSFIRKATNTEELMRLARGRLRPILMTSITTILGLATLIFFASGQAMILQPMAVSLGFGLAWATVLNLLYVPLLFAVIYRVKPE